MALALDARRPRGRIRTRTASPSSEGEPFGKFVNFLSFFSFFFLFMAADFNIFQRQKNLYRAKCPSMSGKMPVKKTAKSGKMPVFFSGILTFIAR